VENRIQGFQGSREKNWNGGILKKLLRVTGCGLKTFGNDGKERQESRKKKNRNNGMMEC
jgi:hypothetical protein